MSQQATSDGEYLQSGPNSEVVSFATGNVVIFEPVAPTPLPAPIPNARSLSDLIDEYEQSADAAALLASGRREVAQTLYADEPESFSALRLAAGMSQKQLAALVGTSQPHIARIELGKADPSTDTIARIANALGVDEERMFRAIRNKRESLV